VVAIADALADAELTLDELTEAIVERVGPWAGDPVMEAFQGKWPRWRQMEDVAANRGALCFGPNRESKVTYTNPRRWLPTLTTALSLPGRGSVEATTAIAQVLKRYLYAYGPSTPQRFAQWLSVPPRWASELFDSLSSELEQVEVEGAAAWVEAGDRAMPSRPPEGVRLLPYFDAYAYAVGNERELLYPGSAAERVSRGGYQTLIVDGVVGGLWHQRRAGRYLDITVEAFDSLTAKQLRELDEQAGRVGEFVGADPRLILGPVTAGAHA
jgi:hypothetical protein